MQCVNVWKIIWFKVLQFWFKGWHTRLFLMSSVWNADVCISIFHFNIWKYLINLVESFAILVERLTNKVTAACLYCPTCQTVQQYTVYLFIQYTVYTLQHVKQSNQPTSNVPKGRVNQIWRRTTMGTYSLIIIIILQYLFTIFYTICGNILEYIQKRTTTRTETKTILTTQQKEGRMVIW